MVDYFSMIDNPYALVKKVYSGYKDTWYYNDLVQEGVIELWRSQNKFKPEKGSYIPFCIARLKGNLSHRLEMLNTKKRGKYTTIPISVLDESVVEGGCVSFIDVALPDESETVEEAVETKIFIETMLKRVSERDRYILVERSKGYTQREIAHKLGTTHQRIQQLESNAIKKIRKIYSV